MVTAEISYCHVESAIKAKASNDYVDIDGMKMHIHLIKPHPKDAKKVRQDQSYTSKRHDCSRNTSVSEYSGNRAPEVRLPSTPWHGHYDNYEQPMYHPSLAVQNKAIYRFCLDCHDQEAGQSASFQRPKSMEKAADYIKWYQHSIQAMRASKKG